MLPKYTKYEIQRMVRAKLSESERIDLNSEKIDEILSHQSFWQSEHYYTAAEVLEVNPEVLLEMLPGEALDSVSFRAEENTSEINTLIKEVNVVFEMLAYQAKIGDIP